MMHARLTAAGDDVDVLSATFRAQGSGDDAADVASVRLLVDVNGNGTLADLTADARADGGADNAADFMPAVAADGAGTFMAVPASAPATRS